MLAFCLRSLLPTFHPLQLSSLAFPSTLYPCSQVCVPTLARMCACFSLSLFVLFLYLSCFLFFLSSFSFTLSLSFCFLFGIIIVFVLLVVVVWFTLVGLIRCKLMQGNLEDAEKELAFLVEAQGSGRIIIEALIFPAFFFLLTCLNISSSLPCPFFRLHRLNLTLPHSVLFSLSFSVFLSLCSPLCLLSPSDISAETLFLSAQLQLRKYQDEAKSLEYLHMAAEHHLKVSFVSLFDSKNSNPKQFYLPSLFSLSPSFFLFALPDPICLSSVCMFCRPWLMLRKGLPSFLPTLLTSWSTWLPNSFPTSALSLFILLTLPTKNCRFSIYIDPLLFVSVPIFFDSVLLSPCLLASFLLLVGCDLCA